MRLVHYYPRALVGDGGPTQAMWKWAGAVHDAGREVAVMYDAALRAESPLRHPAIPILPLTHTGKGRLRFPMGLRDYLGVDDVLVLHSSYVPGNIAAAWLAEQARVPYVVMPHGGYNRRARTRRRLQKGLWLPVERRYLEHALAVHLFFDTETADAAEVAPHARWILAPTGYDPATDGWDGGTGGYLAWLGRYDIRTKGLDLLVRALEQLPASDRRPLRLHGRSSEDRAEDVVSIARSAGVAAAVTAGGEIGGADKVQFFRRAAAYVHPSRWESHSIAIVEALAHGTPTVVSQGCSMASRLQAADAAVVVEPTPEAIAAGISTVLRRPQYYSERAVDFVRTNLAWKGIVSSYLQQIERLIGREVRTS